MEINTYVTNLTLTEMNINSKCRIFDACGREGDSLESCRHSGCIMLPARIQVHPEGRDYCLEY